MTPQQGEVWLVESAWHGVVRVGKAWQRGGTDGYRVFFVSGDDQLSRIIETVGWLADSWFLARVMTP